MSSLLLCMGGVLCYYLQFEGGAVRRWRRRWEESYTWLRGRWGRYRRESEEWGWVKVKRRLGKGERERWRGRGGEEMPQAAERRNNCHMQSSRSCVCVCLCTRVCLCVYKPLHSNALLLSRWTGEPPSVCSQTVYKPNSRSAAGIRSKHEDNGLIEYREETCPTLLHNGLIWQRVRKIILMQDNGKQRGNVFNNVR